MANDRPAFSRSGESNPFGKCDDPLQTWLPAVIKERFAALAVMKGYGSASEYARELIMEKVVGEFELVRLKANRTNGSSGIASE